MDNIIISGLFILVISAVSVVLSYFLIRSMYTRIIQNQLEGNVKVYSKQTKLIKKSKIVSLIQKEALIVLRTPSYAFQYFAISITLPLMVYICSNLLQSMLETLTIIDCSYAVAILVISMFSILSNTF